jgi:hypothetical protein
MRLRVEDLPDHVRAAAGLPLSGKTGKRARAPRPRSFTARWSGPDRFDAWTLELEGLELAGLNGPLGLIRGDWRARRKLAGELVLVIQCAGARPALPGPRIIEYCRTYASNPMDLDNLAASFKLLGDALQHLGVIESDRPEILDLRVSQRQRERGRALTRVVIRLR